MTSIIQAKQTFDWDYLIMNSKLSLAFDSTERKVRERERERERDGRKVRDVFAAFQGKNAEINMKAEQNGIDCISM